VIRWTDGANWLQKLDAAQVPGSAQSAPSVADIEDDARQLCGSARSAKLRVELTGVRRTRLKLN